MTKKRCQLCNLFNSLQWGKSYGYTDISYFKDKECNISLNWQCTHGIQVIWQVTDSNSIVIYIWILSAK